MSEFKIAEVKSFEKIKKKLPKQLYKKVVSIVYPQLKINPHFGSNIKKLKGELSGIYSYRIGDYRLFYVVKEEKVLVVVLDLKHQQGAYKG